MILYLKDGDGGETEILVDSAEVELVRDGGTCCDGGDDRSRCQGVRVGMKRTNFNKKKKSENALLPRPSHCCHSF